ncbi:tRNA (adenosine(37)-N6)-threonylcarbamoyltransferase complex transferase subunit TsaD [Temperatibacter marinus]|uniref:tRNA N6-adenosine threonylcarbamoyltransferase n=1 Tax=Temperatibacter marinus TaxID=1456591 RepID=A0AA52EFH3_9PROT|nr:tRNA (adenosine(37)-N6)-threonylcarbamoyltransferase complex transferase subunit TsaD [Temperatibacter marinus]WND03750.1 tRNA (adenosine(37)-N6)-threonylcarbamoyltransferase complex transferase subunit TsaD [Temperatibacter marinus]
MNAKDKITPKYVLGIETSCDETAVAIVSSDKEIIAHKILSQIEEHAVYGGVVPEIAARSHITHLDSLVENCLSSADLALQDMNAIAATTGPGLIGGLMVGMMTAKAMAQSSGLPFIAVNHLAAHALTPRLTDPDGSKTAFPYLMLLMSGGHCQILEVLDVDDFKRLGTTLDDATGEAFDKTAKLLGLGYPGGPQVEQAALKGDKTRFPLPQPMKGKAGFDFSFSGLKTAVRREAEKCVAEHGYLREIEINDLCACFQDTMAKCLMDRLGRAMKDYTSRHSKGGRRLIIAGGVAANTYLRNALESLACEHNFTLSAPPLALCTDNGAMIAWAGMERFLKTPEINEINQPARPRWPLDQKAEPRVGRGKKGAKA